MIPSKSILSSSSEACTSLLTHETFHHKSRIGHTKTLLPLLKSLALSGLLVLIIVMTPQAFAQDEATPATDEPSSTEGDFIEAQPDVVETAPTQTPPAITPPDVALDNTNLDNTNVGIPTPSSVTNIAKAASVKLYNEGVTSYNEGDYPSAIEKFQSLLALEELPNKSKIRTLLARTYTRYGFYLEEEVGDLTEAERNYQLAIEAFRETPVPYDQATKELYSFAHNRLGVMIYSTRYNASDDNTLVALREAFRNFNSAININKANSSAHNNKGIAYSVQGDSRPAIKAFTKAIEYNENNAIAYLNRGTDNFFINDFASALSDFKEVIRYQVISDMITDPTEAAEALTYAQKMLGFTHLALGNSYYHDGLYESAIENYLQAAKSADSVAGGTSELANLKSNIHLYLGTTYAKIGDIPNAKAQLNNALTLNPNFADAYNNFGIVLYDEGNYEGAINYYSMAIERNPRLAEAYLNRGNAYNQLGRIDEARSDYEQASQLGINIFSSKRTTASKKRKTKLYNTYAQDVRRTRDFNTRKKVFSL